MTIFWSCQTCEFTTTNPREAFLHRDRDGGVHHVHPHELPEPIPPRQLTGIERMSIQEIR
jgi:hypothetical protein